MKKLLPPINYFLALILINILNSCSLHTIFLSVLEPASVTLPDSIQRISILPVPGIQSSPDSFKSLSSVLPWIRNSNINLKEIKMGYLHGIYDILSTSPRFQKVVISDSLFYRLDSNRNTYYYDLQKICRHDTTDIVLILNKVVGFDKMDNTGDSYDEIQNYGDNYYYLRSYTDWIFYSQEKDKKIARYVCADTIMLPIVDLMSLEMAQLLYKACYNSGMNSGKRLSPHWSDHMIRSYYSGPGKQMRKAARFLSKNQWNEAASIWNGLADNIKRSIASRAAYNLALAYERDDVLDQACLWITYSDSLSTNKLTSAYKKILDTRLKTKSTLDKQMAGN